MDERQNSIERQCSMNRASDLCCAGKIELTALEDTAARMLTWIQQGQPAQSYTSAPTPSINSGPVQTNGDDGGPPASEKQKGYLIKLLAKCTWDEGRKGETRAQFDTMSIGTAKALIGQLKAETGM